ncbi:MAG: hypothetical protein NE327_14655 [Lentisphaeraceae bacterium]|nr:hypothetical protein [Lentisphaeraceae bacterium]
MNHINLLSFCMVILLLSCEKPGNPDTVAKGSDSTAIENKVSKSVPIESLLPEGLNEEEKQEILKLISENKPPDTVLNKVSLDGEKLTIRFSEKNKYNYQEFLFKKVEGTWTPDGMLSVDAIE